MFGSRKSDGAASTPATAPSTAASPQVTASIAPTWIPTRRASTGLTAAARSPRPIFVRVKSSPTSDETDDRDGDHADVLLRERDAGDVNRSRRERARERSRSRHPRSTVVSPLIASSKPDGEDHDREQRASLQRPDQDLFDRHAAAERENQRRRERGPERPAVVDQRPADERGQRRHLTLREVDHAGGAVDDHDREREQPVDAAVGQTADDMLAKFVTLHS